MEQEQTGEGLLKDSSQTLLKILVLIGLYERYGDKDDSFHQILTDEFEENGNTTSSMFLFNYIGSSLYDEDTMNLQLLKEDIKNQLKTKNPTLVKLSSNLLSPYPSFSKSSQEFMNILRWIHTNLVSKFTIETLLVFAYFTINNQNNILINYETNLRNVKQDTDMVILNQTETPVKEVEPETETIPQSTIRIPSKNEYGGHTYKKTSGKRKQRISRRKTRKHRHSQ
jgi:hypothetical protein